MNEMNEMNRNNIIMCCGGFIWICTDNIQRLLGDKNSEKGYVDYARMWANQMKSLLDFIDGVDSKK